MTIAADPGLNGRAFTAAQSFLLGSKLYWTRTLYPNLADQYRTKAALAPTPPDNPATVGDMIADTADYRLYAWLERHLQRMKYSGRYGLQPYHAQQRPRLEERITPDALPDGLLELEPGIDLPKYYTAVDIHQHPGGVWGDRIAGFVYERGARSTTPAMGARHADLHDRLVDAVAVHTPTAPGTILDMACGFGKSTAPFYNRYRDASVVGIDLSAPCLALAARTAADNQAANVRYKQRNAYDTGFDDRSFDLVTSTMLLHEMPPPQVLATFDEAARVLKPGGVMAHLDFYHLDSAFARFIHYGHARRNNEPFMEPFAEMDIAGALESRGFKDIEITPYAEDDGALDESHTGWRFPWTLITARRAA